MANVDRSRWCAVAQPLFDTLLAYVTKHTASTTRTPHHLFMEKIKQKRDDETRRIRLFSCMLPASDFSARFILVILDIVCMEVLH
jgi:hypothetical protein